MLIQIKLVSNKINLFIGAYDNNWEYRLYTVVNQI